MKIISYNEGYFLCNTLKTNYFSEDIFNVIINTNYRSKSSPVLPVAGSKLPADVASFLTSFLTCSS